LIAAEKEFSRGCKIDGAARHYATFLDPDARLHRGGVFPIVGREKIVGMLTRAQVSVGWEPSGGDVARSGDLGYTYGSYEATHGGQPSPVEKGYYTRVWRKDERGEWKVVADISNPLPAGKK
jgi:ketosteroid isomerase-like protein